MRFDRVKFFDGVRNSFGALNATQVDGLNFILDSAEKDTLLTNVAQFAYMLATVKHETGNTYQPIHEYGSHAYFVNRYGSQTAIGKRLGNKTPEEGATFSGEGDVQLTGHSNYIKAQNALIAQYAAIVSDFEARTGKKFSLFNNPEEAGDPAIAYAIMSYGMRTGLFTTRKLSEFVNDSKADYINARRVINGTDKAELIAGYADEFEAILNASLDTGVQVPVVIPPVAPVVQQPSAPVLVNPDTSAQTQTTTSTSGVLDSAQQTLGEASGKFDQVQSTITTVTTRADAAKSMWAAIGGSIKQVVWAIIAFATGMPWYIWLGTAVLTTLLVILYMHRQLVLGRIREFAKPRLPDPQVPPIVGQ